MNAAGLDRLCAATASYQGAIAGGATEDAALQAARLAAEVRRQEQFLRSVAAPPSQVAR